MVVRAELVRARALDLNSKTLKVEADELLAQALEHEIDHLNGIMYMDHLVAHTSLYKIVEQPDGSEEDARYETEDAAEGDANGAGDEHHNLPSPEFDAMHRQLHEMRGEASESDAGAVETTGRQ